MAPPPSEENIRKRLTSVNYTQESVQTCSKWLLHHRDSIDKIASYWLDIYKSGNDKLRIALVYVLNDVVQKAASKRDINVTLTFHPHLINATTMANLNVKKVISRCVEVFEQRNIYPAHIIEEVKTALVSKIAIEKEKDESSGEIDYSTLTRGVEKFYKNEVLAEKGRDILSRSSFKFKESVQARVKDRNEGVKALADMDSSRQKLVTFLQSVEKHQKEGERLLHVAKQARTAFNLQLRDVTVVNDAYEKFAEGIRETKRQLEAIERSGVMLGESPPRDAPSPTAGEDPFLHGVEGEEADGGEDMEMDDDDAPGPSSCFLKKEYVAHSAVHSTTIERGTIPPNVSSQMPQLNMGGSSRPAVMDPRQARFFPPPPSTSQHIQIPPYPPPSMNVPPPGLSPPPLPHQQQASQLDLGPGMNISVDPMKQQPPAQHHQFFAMPPPPQVMNGNATMVTTPTPTTTMFNPTNPPPLIPTASISMMNSPPPSLLSQQISPPSHFQIPPPGLINPAPLFSHPGPGDMVHAKRRNSSATEYGFNNRPKRGRRGGRGEHQNWQPRGRGGGDWRRSYEHGGHR